MKQYVFAIALASLFVPGLLAGAGCAAHPPTSPEERAGDRILQDNLQNPGRDDLSDAEIRSMLVDHLDADRQGVGMVLGIIDERGARTMSHGYMDQESGRPVDGDTLFEIGSITKLFTGLLLQQMVELGEMKLDDPVRKYLPASVKVPDYAGTPITLLDLAAHTSGLPNEAYNHAPATWRDPSGDFTDEQLYAFLSSYRLPWRPGSRRSYSNLGVGLLAHAICLKTGTDYETLVIERICRPLGMDSTRITLTPELNARLATGYALPGARALPIGNGAIRGAGALRSTANDLLKFISANLGLTQTPLTPVMMRTRQRHRTQGGLEGRIGWEPGPIFMHGGQTFGYRAQLGFDAESRRGAVVLANCGSSRLVGPMLPLVVRNRGSRPPRIVATEPELLDAFVGQYRVKDGAICAIRRDGERLLMQWIGPRDRSVRYPSFELFPQSSAVFYNQFWGNRATFVRDGFGRVSQLIHNGKTVAKRVSDEPPALPGNVVMAPGTLERYTGRYRLTLLLSHLAIGPTVFCDIERDDLGEHLVAYVPGMGGGELYPESEHAFFTPIFSSHETFVMGRHGKAKGVRVWINKRSAYLTRVGDLPLQAPQRQRVLQSSLPGNLTAAP